MFSTKYKKTFKQGKIRKEYAPQSNYTDNPAAASKYSLVKKSTC